MNKTFHTFGTCANRLTKSTKNHERNDIYDLLRSGKWNEKYVADKYQEKIYIQSPFKNKIRRTLIKKYK